MTYRTEVLKWLKKNPKKGLTNLMAVQLWACTRLGDVIHSLREQGHDILTITEKKASGRGTHGRYILIREAK